MSAPLWVAAMLGHYLPVRRLRALALLSVLLIAGVLLSRVVDLGQILPLQATPPDTEPRAEQDRQAPADLGQILEATRARLEELREATAKVTADPAARQEVRRLQQENERLATELRRASISRDSLGGSAEPSNARVAELPADVEADADPGAETARLQAELAKAKEQLSHAMTAMSDMQHARQAASDDANVLRGEAERARQELDAMKAEIQRLRIANVELEKQVIAARMASRPATDSAHQAQELPKPDAALPGVARSEAAFPPRDPQAMADPVEDEEPRSSATKQAAVPERATGAGEPATNAPELAEVDPNGAAAETGSGLADFRASIQVLNDLERKATGVDLFSDTAVVSARAVNIAATPAWAALPAVAKQTYLDALLADWVAIQGGEGPAVVRIVDPGGRVLIEKSLP